MIKPINIMLCIPTRFSICSHNYSTNPTSLILIFRVVVNCLLCTLSCAPVFRMPNASHWLYQSNIFFTYLSIYLEFISPQTENLTRTQSMQTFHFWFRFIIAGLLVSPPCKEQRYCSIGSDLRKGNHILVKLTQTLPTVFIGFHDKT